MEKITEGFHPPCLLFVIDGSLVTQVEPLFSVQDLHGTPTLSLSLVSDPVRVLDPTHDSRLGSRFPCQEVLSPFKNGNLRGPSPYSDLFI